VICGVSLAPGRKHRYARWCSEHCRQAYLARPREAGDNLNPLTGVVPSGTVGAINEYKVVIDLMSKGYGIYRACSPNSSCDLVVIKGTQAIRVEVTKGYYANKEGRYHYDKHKDSADDYDIIAVVLHDKIVYLTKGDAVFTETQL
jgi:hypothetical protein